MGPSVRVQLRIDQNAIRCIALNAVFRFPGRRQVSPITCRRYHECLNRICGAAIGRLDRILLVAVPVAENGF